VREDEITLRKIIKKEMLEKKALKGKE